MQPDLPLAVTCGEPAGIAGELVLKAWLGRQAHALPPFYVVGDPAYLETLAQRMGFPVPIWPIRHTAEAAGVFANHLPVWPLRFPAPIVTGHPDPACAGTVIESIRLAVEQVQAGLAAAIVTSPIQKDTLYQAGFPHPGHTEYLGALCGDAVQPAMMLAGPGLRVVPATVHVPLSAVPAALTVEKLVCIGRITLNALQRDFGIPAPRLVVAGLNPHAGENGRIGQEESQTIQPAVDALKAEGWHVTPPQSADTLFHAEARKTYDAVLCMYHDQALIPLKTLHFWDGVNITLGLPVVRTSPDHGTGLDIAGRGIARADSLVAAIHAAATISARRRACKGNQTNLL